MAPSRVDIDYLEAVATIQDSAVQKRLLSALIKQYVILEKRVDGLLKNTLPAVVAEEIKFSGKFPPRPYDCTILFSDIVGFTQMAEKTPGEQLIEMLDNLFREMDDLTARHNGTKVKTIGDAYMAVFGAPVEQPDHPLQAVRTGLAFSEAATLCSRRHGHDIRVRIGIHTGRVMGGVVGRERMQFDVFGDAVNIASWFESSGKPGKVNISMDTHTLVADRFLFEERGEIALKNRGNMHAFFAVKEKI
jgi:class 3 adenylate cyclase